MKNKKITAILTILFLSLSLTACSSGKVDVSQESSSAIETSEEKEEETETTKESESSEEETKTTKEEETTKESESKVEESKEETKETETKESKTSENSKQSTPKQEETKQAETKQTETTPAPHTHNYSSSVIVSPTCSANGVEKFTCTSCGESYEQSIPATGQHTYEPKYEVVQHEAKGEIRQVPVQVGTSGDVYTCCYCGAEFSSHSDITNHWLSYDDLDHAGSNYLIRDGEPIYEYQNEWVVTEEAWTETVITSYICTTCGKSKN